MYIILSIVVILLISGFTWWTFHKRYEWAPVNIIILFVSGMLLFGALCGQKVVDNKEITFLPGQFDYGKSKYKYVINYWYPKDGLIQDGYFVGASKYEYDLLSDSTILVLRLDYNSYGVELNRGYRLVKSK